MEQFVCGRAPDSGEPTVQDGSVENYPFDWEEPLPANDTPAEGCPCAAGDTPLTP